MKKISDLIKENAGQEFTITATVTFKVTAESEGDAGYAADSIIESIEGYVSHEIGNVGDDIAFSDIPAHYRNHILNTKISKENINKNTDNSNESFIDNDISKENIDDVIAKAQSEFKNLKELNGLEYRKCRSKIEAYGRICRGMIELVSIEEEFNYRDIIFAKIGEFINKDPDNKLFASYFTF